MNAWYSKKTQAGNFHSQTLSILCHLFHKIATTFIILIKWYLSFGTINYDCPLFLTNKTKIKIIQITWWLVINMQIIFLIKVPQSMYSRGATFWAFFKNHDAPILNASILHQLTLKRPSDPKKNRRRNFPKPKTSNFGPKSRFWSHFSLLDPYFLLKTPPNGPM